MHPLAHSRPARTPRELLQCYRLPQSLEEAHQYLDRLSLCLHILDLYQHSFPDAFARSLARSLPQDDEAYSPREAEFFMRVDAELFPIYVDFLIGGAAPDERSAAIPIASLGRSIFNEEVADLPEEWQLAFFLAGEISAEDFAASHPELTPTENSPVSLTTATDWPAFFREWHDITEASDPVIAAVLPALEMAAHDTGNAFLDPTEETPIEGYHWNREDVDSLWADFRQALVMLRQVEDLFHWLTEEPARLPVLLEQIQGCLHVQGSPDDNEEETNDDDTWDDGTA